MKKHLLILASLVFGIGQLFADEAIFDASVLWKKLGGTGIKAQTVTTPYTWEESPGYVKITFDGEGTQTVNTTYIPFSKGKSFTVAGTTTGTTISKITFTINQKIQADFVGAASGIYSADTDTGIGTWIPEDGTTPSSVTFTTTNSFQVKTITVEYTPDENFTPDVPATGFEEPFEATPVDNLASYSGNAPYIYDKASMKFYALNNLGEYEEYGVVTEVNTLKVAGNGITEIEYIKTNTSMATIPYINLNYIPKKNTRAVCTLEALEGGDWKAAYGCGYFQDGWKDRFCFFTTNATINLGGETGNKDAMRYGKKIVTEMDAATGLMNIYEADGTTLIGTITDSPKEADCKTSLYVFAQNKDVPGGEKITDCYNPFITLYGLDLYEGDTKVMELVPAIDGEGNGGLKDKLTGTFYGPANNGNFELSSDGQAAAGQAGITAYEGKIVIFEGHEYEYFNGSWVDRGQMVYQSVSEVGTDYRNLSNWSYPGSDYDATFGVNNFDGTTNTLSPYVGNGGWEPLTYKLTGLTKGESYRVSFNYTGNAWYSWSSYTTLPFFVLDYESLPWNDFNNPDQALAYTAMPNTETSNQPYYVDFIANHSYALMCIQFGVVDDGSHPITTDDPNQKWKEAYGAFAFSFGDIKVEKRVLPQPYNAIDWADPVKYTLLEYIENVSAPRERAFTLPYNPVTATQIDAKFMVYDTSTGWCGIFCGRNHGAGSGISLYMNGNDRAHFGYFTGGTTGGGDNFAPFSLNTDYEVSADVTKLVVNGETYNTGNTVTNPTTRNLSLFANPENDNPMRGRFYYCTISEAGEKVYDFKPAMRHDGVFGFYDKASRTFVLPAQGGNLDGYSYKKHADQANVTYKKDTRIVSVGSTGKFLPEVQNLDGATFTWTSSDDAIATVAADGTVTGVAAGKVTITVTTDADQGWTASYELTVSEPDYKRVDANNVRYAIVTGGTGWNDSPLSALLDNDATTKFGCSNTSDAWAIIIASEPVAVKQYSFVTGADTYNYPARNPRSWKLEGSNDNQTWTLIDEHNDFDAYKIHSVNKQEFEFPVNGTETFKFFKFSATSTGDGFQLGEFWINEQTHAWGEPTETASTCTVPGKKVWECTTSKVLKTETLPLAEHEYENGACACGAKASEVVLLPNGQDNAYAIKFRHQAGVSDNEFKDIEAGWNEADFDDSNWDELMMPIGGMGYDGGARNGAKFNTIWFNEYNTYWFRRPFTIENPAAITKLTVKALHDDDYAIFVNGTKVFARTGWTDGTNWEVTEVDPSLLVAGQNVLAVYVEQNFGGAYCDFSLEANVGAKVTVSDAGYATFVAPVDVDFTGSEVTPKAATFDGTYVQLADVTTVPAGTAVVVKAAEGTYTVPATTDAVLGATNELIAATADVTADGTQYILAKQDDEVGFAQATSGTIAAGKGYLKFTTAVKAFYPFAGNDATGISGIEAINGDAPIYNVAGQRLGKMQKGINIVGGKKVLK